MATFCWEPSLGNFDWGAFAWEVSLGKGIVGGQEAHRGAHDAARRRQEVPTLYPRGIGRNRTPPAAQTGAQEAPKMHPGGKTRHLGGIRETSRRHPRDPQEAPRGAQEAPKVHPGGTRIQPGGTQRRPGGTEKKLMKKCWVFILKVYNGPIILQSGECDMYEPPCLCTKKGGPLRGLDNPVTLGQFWGGGDVY